MAVPVEPSIDSFTDTMNAAASILWPADPAVATDLAAGDLIDPLNGDTFAVQWIRLLRFVDNSGIWYLATLIATTQDGIDVFGELDAQAVNRFAVASYAAASGVQQLQIMTEALEAALVTIYTLPLTPIEFQILLKDVAKTGSVAYWGQNWPYHRVRQNLLGMGRDDCEFPAVNNSVILTDVPNLISNPRVVPNGGSAYNYQQWPYPLVFSIETLIKSAFLDANDAGLAAQSEADLASLIAQETAKTLWTVTA